MSAILTGIIMSVIGAGFGACLAMAEAPGWIAAGAIMFFGLLFFPLVVAAINDG